MLQALRVCVRSSCFLTVGSHYRSIDWCESEIGLVVLLFAYTSLLGIIIRHRTQKHRVPG
jgi:hypothetical protein